MLLRFDADYGDPALSFDPLVDEVFGELKSTFLEMPRGDGFVDYAAFEKGYQALKRETAAFSDVTSATVVADLGVPYPVLLYERFLGRPFASHRDSVSELVGEVVEGAIKDVLTATKISFRETNRAERVTGFDQTPDFIIPDEFNPVAVIEAKLTEDDGTARDKVTRVQRLQTLRDQTGHTYDVIACIAGRGFKVRREDMRRLLQATDGKVFTLPTMHLLIDQTRIREYRSQ